ncbi:MAG: hypothetical protein JKX76_01270 [Colwellia sp.]|nr:hypothetical protein [Colwellia sp.]
MTGITTLTGTVTTGGDVVVGNTLNVTGIIITDSTLSVAGISTLTGNVGIGGDLDVSGTTSFDSITTVGNVDIGADLDVTGSIDITGDVAISQVLHLSTNGFQLGTSTNNGYVLTVDSFGFGSWQLPTGIETQGSANPDVFQADLSGSVYNIGLINNSQDLSFGGGIGVVYITNADTIPSTGPVDGGLLFCSGGALFFKGSNETLTFIASA